MYFGYSVIIFPREKVVAFHLKKLESPLPRDAKFDWNWPSTSGEAKQEAHGHIAHLKNQFKWINTFQQSYGCIITLIRSRIKPLSASRELNALYL